MADQFETIQHLGQGTFGVCKLAKDLTDGELVAVKYIRRGKTVDKNCEREVLVHSGLCHPNVIGFKRVLLTDDMLCLVLEYASGGELFDRVKKAGRFSEDMARFFFQQLIAGVAYLHERGVAHRDLKLENTLIKLESPDPASPPTPVLKISDFGFAKREDYHSAARSRVGTPAYVSPEVLEAHQGSPYDGKAADVWSCGVHLYIMLVGWYPFTDPRDVHNFPKTATNIKSGKYAFPPGLELSEKVKELIKRMLLKDPSRRITISEIYQDAWFQTNLSQELMGEDSGLPRYPPCTQPHDEIKELIRMAKQDR